MSKLFRFILVFIVGSILTFKFGMTGILLTIPVTIILEGLMDMLCI